MTTTKPTYRPAAVHSLFAAHRSQTEKHAFSAKERDTETGLSYFGARYYSSELSLWLSVDPMASKYPSLSPYVYCADNPVNLVDPNGEEIGDYFDENGVFLMNDGRSDGRVYIVNRDEWNHLWDKCKNLPDEIKDTPELLHLLSSARPPSSVNLSNNAIYNILRYYNPTKLLLYQAELDKSILFQTSTETIMSKGFVSFNITLYCNIQGWQENKYFLNNSYDILSSYDNEIGHIKSASLSYVQLSAEARELKAINYQRLQDSYAKTSIPFKIMIEDYFQKCSDIILEK